MSGGVSRLHPLEGARATGDGAVAATGGALAVRLDDVDARWLEIAISISGPELTASPSLQVDQRGHVPQVIALPMPASGATRALVHLAAGRKELRLKLADAPAGVRIGPVALVRIAAASALVRLGLPVLRRRLREPWDLPRAATKLAVALLRGGLRGLLDVLHRKSQHEAPQLDYGGWARRYAAVSSVQRGELRGRLNSLESPPRISVLLPVFDPPGDLLERAIASVERQSYEHWELCIADDASRSPAVRATLEAAVARNPRIRLVIREKNGHISAASNSALALATGDWIALLDHDDELTEDALARLALEIASHPAVDFIYSDEDKLDPEGLLVEPHFKPDWNPDLLRSTNYVGHLAALRTTMVRDVGGFREGFEGSQDHDLFLRVSERARGIRHIPRVLYHWRIAPGSTAGTPSTKDYAGEAGLRAVQEHLDRSGSGARAEPSTRVPHAYRVRWPLPSPPPAVDIVVPTRDALPLLRTCIGTLRAKTAGPPYRVVVVDNQSREPATLAWLREEEQAGHLRVLPWNAPFNFSAMNNAAVRASTAEVVVLLNNDMEILDGDWLRELVSHAVRPDVGAVGARLLYPDRTLQHAGIILGIGGVAGHAHKHIAETASGYACRPHHTQQLSAVTAACLAIRRSVYLEVGGLDESLAVAFNDVDFCLRVQAAGYRNVWTPHATLVHHESKSRGPEDTRAKQQRFRREVALMMKRWGQQLRADPAYNPNLTLDAENFSLAWPPRE